MMKFATYENIVEMAYKHLIPTPKDQTSKPVQLGVSFGSGYVAGVFCAAISHPADNLVSFLNNAKGATVADVNTNAYLNSTLLLFYENLCAYCIVYTHYLFFC
jgi:solute carrier family 25 phosphate transporter 3